MKRHPVKEYVRHKNRIRFNCSAFMIHYFNFPENCYNCMRRDGAPQNLGGDAECKNFVPKKERRKTS